MDPIHIFAVFAMILAVGIIVQVISRLTQMPSIVFLLVRQVAKNKFGFGRDKLVARVNDPKNLSTFRDLSIRSMSPITSAASILDNLITHPNLFSMYELGERGDIIEIPVESPEVIGKPV